MKYMKDGINLIIAACIYFFLCTSIIVCVDLHTQWNMPSCAIMNPKFIDEVNYHHHSKVNSKMVWDIIHVTDTILSPRIGYGSCYEMQYQYRFITLRTILDVLFSSYSCVLFPFRVIYSNI